MKINNTHECLHCSLHTENICVIFSAIRRFNNTYYIIHTQLHIL